MGALAEFLTGRALRDNPQFANNYYQQQEQIANNAYLKDLMGVAGRPMEMGQQVENTPTQYGQMDLNVGGVDVPKMEGFRPETQGSGLLGGNLSPIETAMKFMQAPSQQTRALGGNMMNQLMQPKQGRAMTEMDLFLSNPEAFKQFQQAKQGQKTPTEMELFLNDRNAFNELLAARAAAKRTAEGSGALDIKERANISNQLRDDFRTDTKEFGQINNYWDRIKSAKPTGPGDLSLVFSYMKMIDPTSSVQQGEQASAANAGGTTAYIRGIYNNLLGKGNLDEKTRQQFKEQAGQFYNQALEGYNINKQDYLGRAEGYGIDPKMVMGSQTYSPYQDPVKEIQQAAQTAPAPQQAAPKGPVKVQGVSYPVSMINSKALPNGQTVAQGNDGKYYYQSNGQWIQAK